MKYTCQSKKIVWLFIGTIFSCSLWAVNEDLDLASIGEAQDLIKELGKGLSKKKSAIVVACTFSCSDAKREALHRFNRFIVPYVNHFEIKETSLDSLISSYQDAVQQESTPTIIQKESVSFWHKLKWASVGATICAVTCGIISLLSFDCTTH